MSESIEDKQSIAFYVPREDGGENCLMFDVQPNGNVWVDMSGGGGAGPDVWDVEIEEFSELTPENMLALAAWLTAKATDERKGMSIKEYIEPPTLKKVYAIWECQDCGCEIKTDLDTSDKGELYEIALQWVDDYYDAFPEKPELEEGYLKLACPACKKKNEPQGVES